ncbi:hypothetical protein PLCT1_01175 [Planctomycetaceae bacterium]|nr:hypothetical protein PLCT1_01175 [Planctomycetaceae bacterium]
MRGQSTMEPSEYTPLPREAHAFIDGLLDSESERAFVRKMERDPSLKQRVDEIQAARRMLASVAMIEPPADFDKGLIERLRFVDLAGEARQRIGKAGSPLWQRIALIGAGALAASVVLTIMLPNVNSPASLPVGNTEYADFATVASVSEADVMPVIADQYDRFREMKRNVLYANVDSQTRRDLVRGELELSDIGPRSKRLRAMVQGLPEPQRREYLRFFDSLSACCEAIDAELVKSRNEGSEPDLRVLSNTLASVYLPARLSEESSLQVVRFGPSPRSTQATRVSVGGDRELSMYLTAREAHYARDYDRAAKAFGAYLGEYSRGRFADCAKAGRAVALLRAGFTDLALDCYINDVRDNTVRAALVGSTDQALFRQAELERQRRTPAPKEPEDK